MGSSMYYDRKYIPKRTNAEVVREFAELVESLGIHIDYENATTLYLWKRNRSEGIRVYAETAEEDEYPEPFGMYYREIFFDAVYDDDDIVNSDLLLEITIAYMKKYPDTLLFGECSPYFYYDKQDIDMVASEPFRSDWHYMTKSHISPLTEKLYEKWRKIKNLNSEK
ncbi:MAG: hypothetical protein K2H28_04860 [Ruminococcus sp.]|nr:hypothetical protein [Ruminococcus sp.]